MQWKVKWKGPSKSYIYSNSIVPTRPPPKTSPHSTFSFILREREREFGVLIYLMAVMKGGMEQQKKQSLSELMFSESMKRAAKLLVSVSVFSVVFSYMSWRSAFPIQVLSHALDKNYMFLVCNGILVLLAKTSGRVVVRSGPAVYDDLDDDEELHAPTQHAKLLDSLLHKEALADSSLLLLENADDSDHHDDEEEEEEKHVIEEEEEDDDSRSLMMIMGNKQEEEGDGSLKMEEDCRSCIMEGEESEDDDDDELEEVNNGVFIEAEKEVVEERERLNQLSAEELNKKFEEFIRKMKEDIRIEAQQQHLLLVK